MKSFLLAIGMALICSTANAQCPGGVCNARRPTPNYSYYYVPQQTAPVPVVNQVAPAPVAVPVPVPQTYYYYPFAYGQYLPRWFR